MDKITMSIEETAEALGISRGRAYKAAKNGELPVVRFGHRLLVPRAALVRMIEERIAGKDGAATPA